MSQQSFKHRKTSSVAKSFWKQQPWRLKKTDIRISPLALNNQGKKCARHLYSWAMRQNQKVSNAYLKRYR